MLELFNFIVLVLTLSAVVWYTWITNNLHKAARDQLAEIIKQRRLSIIPALLPELTPYNGPSRLQLTNIGNGVAANISIDDVKYSPEKLKNTFYRFNTVPLLRQSESRILMHESYLQNTVSQNDGGLAHLKKEYAENPVILRITFQDLEGTRYEQLFQMGKGGYKHISIKLAGK